METRIGLIGKCGSCGHEVPAEELELDLELNIPICRTCAFLDHRPTRLLIETAASK
jgi:hypothetical protein